MSGGGSASNRVSVGGTIRSRAAYGRTRGVVQKPAAWIGQEVDAWQVADQTCGRRLFFRGDRGERRDSQPRAAHRNQRDLFQRG